METELQKLESSTPRSMSKCSSIIIRDDHQSDVKYTSLKDVFSAADPPVARRNSSVLDINSSTISIKNQLVKHAASAYLQSAAIIAARDQNWFTSVWRQMRWQRIFNSRWQECVRGPVGLCVGLIMRAVRRMVAHAATQVVIIRSRSTQASL
ncbi:uncharacterized protein A4U43_C06F18890 [Asparagus officinalis]|uniref:Uncharacterized protein n=1 Tax=Asparagus officinalis TaxID=4686 RepID=A0A5P1EQB6_ASPOF|nr:uncharacterized protein LOC109845368 [Asparagus officinalis]ONK67317.1 uncharacterized protein A4U43_C06F18890 [Asparagus officinalis]